MGDCDNGEPMKKTWEGIRAQGSSYSEGGWMVCHFVLRWAETQQFLVMASK